MKKLIIIPTIIAAIILAIVIFKAPDSSNIPKGTENLVNNYEVGAAVPMYIVKSYNDSIGIYKPGALSPFKTISDVSVSMLTKYDKELLKKGIEVYSERELISIIEDYDG